MGNLLEDELVENLEVLYGRYRDLVEKANPLQLQINELKAEMAEILFLVGGEIKVKEVAKFKLVNTSIQQNWDNAKLLSLLEYLWVTGNTETAQLLTECKFSKPVDAIRRVTITPTDGLIAVKPLTLIQKLEKQKPTKPQKPPKPKTCAGCGKAFIFREEKGVLLQNTCFEDGKKKVNTTYFCHVCAELNHTRIAS